MYTVHTLLPFKDKIVIAVYMCSVHNSVCVCVFLISFNDLVTLGWYLIVDCDSSKSSWTPFYNQLYDRVVSRLCNCYKLRSLERYTIEPVKCVV